MSALVKRTYTIPEDIAKNFESSVPVGRRSAVITEIMSEWLDNRKLEALQKNVIAGCLDMADVQIELEREFHPLEEDIQEGNQT